MIDFITDLGEEVISIIIFAIIIIVLLIIIKLSRKKNLLITKIKNKIMWSSVFRTNIQMFLPNCIFIFQ